jgi:hypothetical protein
VSHALPGTLAGIFKVRFPNDWTEYVQQLGALALTVVIVWFELADLIEILPTVV